MPPAPYPDFRWVFHSVRILPVVAIAALVGGAIGGFSVFAIDLAISPLRHDVQTKQASAERPPKVNEIKPSLAAEAPAHAPAGGTSAPPPVQGSLAPSQQAAGTAGPGAAATAAEPSVAASTQAPQIAVTPPLPAPQKVWPDALSRRHEETQRTG